MKIKIQTIIVELGVLLATLITVIVSVYLVPLSEEVAIIEPSIAYMRRPVLLIVWGFLACVLGALIMAFLLLERIRRDKVFELHSIRLLKGIGISALIAIAPLMILHLYTETQIIGTIIIYVMPGIFALIIVAIFFFLIAALFQKAVDYKEEVDLTV